VFERLVLSSNNNESARRMIYSAIRAEQPDAVFHLGDMVATGFYGASWESIDGFVDSLRHDTIPFYPIMGNHELMFFPGVGEREFLGRFPYARKTGYMRRSGRLAVILLNSNMSALTEEERREQQQWYEKALRDLDNDSTVAVVLVGCHHSPFTNSTIVAPADDVRGEFVPPYIRSAKARLFLSGHAHAAEHFREQGKDFLVIGGGGGLQQPLLTGRDRRWIDHFPITSRIRMFHYARCVVRDTSLSFSIRMIADDFSGFREVFRLSIPLPPASVSHGG
jgi:3',5'-cyclic AMP phosphodiesterase CpdA